MFRIQATQSSYRALRRKECRGIRMPDRYTPSRSSEQSNRFSFLGEAALGAGGCRTVRENALVMAEESIIGSPIFSERSRGGFHTANLSPDDLRMKLTHDHRWMET